MRDRRSPSARKGERCSVRMWSARCRVRTAAPFAAADCAPISAIVGRAPRLRRRSRTARADLRALAPLLPPAVSAALLARVTGSATGSAVGGGGVTLGAAGAGTLGTSALAIKGLAGVALIAAAAGVGGLVNVVPHGVNAPEPSPGRGALRHTTAASVAPERESAVRFPTVEATRSTAVRDGRGGGITRSRASGASISHAGKPGRPAGTSTTAGGSGSTPSPGRSGSPGQHAGTRRLQRGRIKFKRLPRRSRYTDALRAPGPPDPPRSPGRSGQLCVADGWRTGSARGSGRRLWESLQRLVRSGRPRIRT